MRSGKGIRGWGSEMEAVMGQVLGGEYWKVWLVTQVHRHLSTQRDVRLKPKPEWRCQASLLSQLPRAASSGPGKSEDAGTEATARS